VDSRAPAVEKLVFRSITKAVGEWSTRRNLVKAAGAGALAAILGASLDETGTDAKRRRVRGEHNIRGNKAIMCINGKTRRVPKKKRNKYLKRGASRGKCPKGCTPVCAPGFCGDDGCGGTCGCTDGTICINDTCEACDVGCASGDSEVCGQALSEALAEGGTIRVCPGTYLGPFKLTKKVGIVGAGSGSNPASNTILLGAEKAGAVVSVQAAIAATLTSLRITGGEGLTPNSDDSGGVYIRNQDADVTIENCALVENTANFGGGVSLFTGTLTVRGSDISYNKANKGGGVATATLATVESTTITFNEAAVQGGGYYLNSGTANLASSVTISDNESKGGAGSGGGIYKLTKNSTISNAATVIDNIPDNCAVGDGNDPFTCP
jgi:hypothetical protein